MPDTDFTPAAAPLVAAFEPPAAGTFLEVAPGILWTRLALPFRLDHVNVYFLEGRDGWTVIDAGISDEATEDAWEAILAGPMKGERLSTVLVTHSHPDHIGMAGWLCRRVDAPLLTSRVSFLAARMMLSDPAMMASHDNRAFYQRHGMEEEVAAVNATLGHDYLRMVSPLPQSYLRLEAGRTLTIGARNWRLVAAEGHCAGQIMLHDAEAGLLLAADHLIERISPNVSVQPHEREEDPLGDYLASLHAVLRDIPDGTLVLSGHHRPFREVHRRTRELIHHHDERCALLLAACVDGPRSAAELLPVMFPRKLTPHETSFAFSEVLAHLNHLVARGDMRWQEDGHHLRAAFAG